jgi:hypothetical protein
MPASWPAHGKEAGMGFFDTVKGKAGALAADAERAGKVTAAQARLVVLQNDLKKAERELGHAAYALAERGELDHPDLTHAIERLRGTSAEVHAKEAEIAALRGEAAPADTTTAATAPAAQTPEPVAAAAAPTTVETASGPVTVTPSAVMAAAAAEAETEAAAAAPEPAPEPPAATPEPSVKKPARKPAARKTAAKTAPATKNAPAGKPAAKATPKKTAPKAGATPKKSTRPTSHGPRPAGKKRPAGS